MKARKLAIFGGSPVRSGPWEWNHTLGQEEISAVEGVIKTGRLSVFRGGPKVKAFETAFAEYSGAYYGIATTSGTSALHAAVCALGIRDGDEVLVPGLTFVSTASVILQERARPVFVDIDSQTYCMSPDDLERKITPHAKAVIPVHLFGQPSAMDQIVSISSRFGLSVISDAAQAHGATINGKGLGNFGDACCYSFFQTKNMTTGEGGIVLTNKEETARRVRLKREHGSPPESATWYAYDELGFNYAMTEMQAAIGLVQLSKLDSFNRRRNDIARIYQDQLQKTRLIIPYTAPGNTHVFHNFPILLPQGAHHLRDDLFRAIRAEGVPIDICYPAPLYRTNLFKECASTAACPVSDSVASRILTLFTDPCLTDKDADDISKAVLKVTTHYLL